MNTAEPIREQQDLERFKDYYLNEKPNPRNYTLLCMGLNTALRISDMLQLQWQDVYDFGHNKFRFHIQLLEQKTGKYSRIYLNQNAIEALCFYKLQLQKQGAILPERYLFEGDKNIPISRVQAWRIIKRAAEACGLQGVISPHSLRKTFGYQAWQQ